MYAQGDDASGEPGGLSTAPGDLRDYVRSHPMRVGILALLAQGERSAKNLRIELPTKPGPPLLDYHLKALRTVGLVDARYEDGVSIYRLA